MIDNVDMMKTQYVHDIIPDDTYFESTSILISGDTISFICDNYCEYIVDSVLESTTEVYKVSTVKGFVLTFKQDAIETESPRGARWINFNTKK